MRVLLSLGSNLGERATNLRTACQELAAHEEIRLLTVSSFFESEPLGVTRQPAFLNAAAEIDTALTPMELLNAAKETEARMGRRPSQRWGPRVIDIDLVLCGDTVVETEALTVPHPRFRDRRFVLAPLAEIAPDAVDPVTGKTVAELAAAPEAQGQVKKLLSSSP